MAREGNKCITRKEMKYTTREDKNPSPESKQLSSEDIEHITGEASKQQQQFIMVRQSSKGIKQEDIKRIFKESPNASFGWSIKHISERRTAKMIASQGTAVNASPKMTVMAVNASQRYSILVLFVVYLTEAKRPELNFTLTALNSLNLWLTVHTHTHTHTHTECSVGPQRPQCIDWTQCV